MTETTPPEAVLAEAVKPPRVSIQAVDGQGFSFTTFEIMRAAKKREGVKSRRVKWLYGLLEEMIQAAQEGKIS